jgi:hypothetical protein
MTRKKVAKKSYDDSTWSSVMMMRQASYGIRRFQSSERYDEEKYVEK